MTDPRFISPSDRELSLESIRRFGWLPKDDARPLPPNIVAILAHAAFMDERDARQRDLIRRLADALDDVVQVSITYTGPGGMENGARLVAEARGIEATNE